jgi:hypothetical protein
MSREDHGARPSRGSWPLHEAAPSLCLPPGGFLIEGGGAVRPSLQARCEEPRAACFFALASRNVPATDQEVTPVPLFLVLLLRFHVQNRRELFRAWDNENVKGQTVGQVAQWNVFAVANSNMSRFGCFSILKTASASGPKGSDAC